MRVLKFGGTSVGTVERIGTVLEVITTAADKGQVCVVVSALGGVTDQLVTAVEKALAGDKSWTFIVDEIKARHADFLAQLANASEAGVAQIEIKKWLDKLENYLGGVTILRECTLKCQDSIICIGERLSAPLITAALRTQQLKARMLDVAELIRTDDNFSEANVDFQVTEELIKQAFKALGAGVIPVVSGFIGATKDNQITTLGRSGSDYTASIFGGILNAEVVEIWTDVDGILSGDPKVVENAIILPYISYDQASELAFYGAKVIHPKTVQPLRLKGIPVVIKNTLRPESIGTLVTDGINGKSNDFGAVTSLSKLAAITVDCENTRNNFDITSRIFKVIAELKYQVYVTSQTFANHSFLFVVKKSAAARIIKELHREFATELKTSAIKSIWVQDELAVVSIFGKHQSEQFDFVYRMSDTFSGLGISVKAVSFSSNQNISIVIEQKHAIKAVNILHNELLKSWQQIAHSVAA